MNELESLINTYTVDLTLKPTTFDLWHVSLAGAVGVLLLLILLMLVGKARNKPQPVAIPTEPEIRIVEKIVEVEKLVHTPLPEPVILKEATPDAALQVLSLLQKEARFIDFIKEDLTTYSDADIGAAARVVHEGCGKAIKAHFTLAPVRNEQEGSRLTLPAGFDAAAVRLTGNIVGSPPFTGNLVHKGWQVTEIHLPKLTQGHNPKIIAAAEVEL